MFVHIRIYTHIVHVHIYIGKNYTHSLWKKRRKKEELFVPFELSFTLSTA